MLHAPHDVDEPNNAGLVAAGFGDVINRPIIFQILVGIVFAVLAS